MDAPRRPLDGNSSGESSGRDAWAIRLPFNVYIAHYPPGLLLIPDATWTRRSHLMAALLAVYRAAEQRKVVGSWRILDRAVANAKAVMGEWDDA